MPQYLYVCSGPYHEVPHTRVFEADDLDHAHQIAKQQAREWWDDAVDDLDLPEGHSGEREDIEPLGWRLALYLADYQAIYEEGE